MVFAIRTAGCLLFERQGCWYLGVGLSSTLYTAKCLQHMPTCSTGEGEGEGACVATAAVARASPAMPAAMPVPVAFTTVPEDEVLLPCAPRTNSTTSLEVRWGSSEKTSCARPQRGSCTYMPGVTTSAPQG